MTTGILTVFLLLALPCLSHKRLAVPIPRDTQTAPRNSAPCGGISFERAYREGRITDWNAGEKVKIVMYEQIYHGGQPVRLAISGPNNEEFDDCIWLNHIPQHVRGQRTGGRNLTIELTVPDMTCKNCTLQLIGFQTGDLTDGECCAYNNNDTKTCALNQYYSCANININGGKRDRADVCVQPEGWAYRSLACNYYRDERSTSAWAQDDNDASNLILKTSGSIEGSQDVSTFCGDSEMPIRRNTACQQSATNFEELALVDGGDMQTEGVVAIILVAILGTVITATYCIAKKRGNAPVSTEADRF